MSNTPALDRSSPSEPVAVRRGEVVESRGVEPPTNRPLSPDGMGGRIVATEECQRPRQDAALQGSGEASGRPEIPSARWDEAAAKIPAFAKKLAPVYALLGWTWYSGDVPTEAKIAETLTRLLSSVREQGLIMARTGGLRVSTDVDELDTWTITLGFQVEERVYVHSWEIEAAPPGPQVAPS